MSISDTKIAEKASEFVDKKYALSNKMEGWDCLNVLIEFYDAIGFPFPRSFEDYTEANYGEKWEKDNFKAGKVLGRFLRTLGRKVEDGRPRRGDLLILEAKELPTFSAIYLGNGQVLMVFDKGVKNVPLKFFRQRLTEVRRLIN